MFFWPGHQQDGLNAALDALQAVFEPELFADDEADDPSPQRSALGVAMRARRHLPSPRSRPFSCLPWPRERCRARRSSVARPPRAHLQRHLRRQGDRRRRCTCTWDVDRHQQRPGDPLSASGPDVLLLRCPIAGAHRRDQRPRATDSAGATLDVSLDDADQPLVQSANVTFVRGLFYRQKLHLPPHVRPRRRALAGDHRHAVLRLRARSWLVGNPATSR